MVKLYSIIYYNLINTQHFQERQVFHVLTSIFGEIKNNVIFVSYVIVRMLSYVSKGNLSPNLVRIQNLLFRRNICPERFKF